MFLSDEPGYYKPNDFGIRIENDMEVVLANLSAYDTTQYLRFNTITFVPYERSLININLLTSEQISAIDQYHENVARILEPLLRDDESALIALRSRTAPLNPVRNKTLIVMGSPILITFVFVFFLFL
jgi:Xaa-Pro aminopeptidase